MGFRAAWYREQEQARQAMMAAKSAARRRRPRARVVQSWSRLEGTSVTLAGLLEDVLQTMRGPTPGQPAPEISVALVADLAEDPPPAVEAPARTKPVNLMGRRRIVAGGRVETHAILAKIEITARLVIYGPPGEAPPPEMSRRTWYLPVKPADKREKSPENQEE